jgi:hypothetical protein
MYLDGAAEGGDHTTYGSWHASYAGLKIRYIGQGNSANIRRVDGNIACTQAWSRALTAAEIKANFSAQKSRFGL